jgi:hypothetical protein
MVDLVEYALLPYHQEIKKPRGLNTLIDGLADIGINKKLIKTKRILVELVARHGY